MKAALIPFLIVLPPVPSALGQLRPQPGMANPHFQTILYSESEVVQIDVAPGFQLVLELAADDQIENVAVGDSGAWQVTANRRGDRLFIKMLQPASPTNVTVITGSRIYALELMPLSGPAPDTPYIVSYRYSEETVQANAPPPTVEPGRYRVSGDRALRPISISDDGVRTTITWPRDAAIPAVYSVDAQGRETLVNGVMKEDQLVIDAVARKLIFRLDRASARAIRLKSERR